MLWPKTGGDFDFAAYLLTEPPPLALVVSARAILTRDGRVLAFESGTGTNHIIPGGRRRPEESLEQTLAREIREETGCAIAPEVRQLGIIHLYNRLPRREGSPYPFPDALWVVYAAAALPGGALISEDEWVRDPRFVEVGALADLKVSAIELAFVEAALR